MHSSAVQNTPKSSEGRRGSSTRAITVTGGRDVIRSSFTSSLFIGFLDGISLYLATANSLLKKFQPT